MEKRKPALKIHWRRDGVHHLCTIFVGPPDGTMACCGQLTFLKEDAIVFHEAFQEIFGFAAVFESGWE